MAAPYLIDRQIPTGWALPEGFPTQIVIADNEDIAFWEKTVQPPGVDGGDPIDTTTMFNTLWKTFHGRFLQSVPPIKVSAAYVPTVLTNIYGLINVNNCINVKFPDHTAIAFWGYLKAFVPQENKEGEQPMADIEIVITNFDCIHLVEAGPVFIAAPGTSNYSYCGNPANNGM